jgi:hypothetical protein
MRPRRILWALLLATSIWLAPAGVRACEGPAWCRSALCSRADGIGFVRQDDSMPVPDGELPVAIVEEVLRAPADSTVFFAGARFKTLIPEHTGRLLALWDSRTPLDLLEMVQVDEAGNVDCIRGYYLPKCAGTPGVTVARLLEVNGTGQCETVTDQAGYNYCGPSPCSGRSSLLGCTTAGATDRRTAGFPWLTVFAMAIAGAISRARSRRSRR